MKKGFVSTMRRGFHMTFANGLTASVQWGAGNYCENHNSTDFTPIKDVSSGTAEVAVFKNGELIDANPFVPEERRDNCDIVCGWLSPDNVAQFLVNVAADKG